MRPQARVFLPLFPFILIALGGCRFVGELAGAAAGGATAAASANPLVGIAVGVAVNSAIDATTNYVTRKRQQAEQDAIAAEVATMDVGDHRPWQIRHDIPIGNEHGEVRVTRVIATPIAVCKELLFSVESGSSDASKRAWYATQACEQGQHWKWALAEPAVERWGSLQ
ncbi:MAG TPA: hypothetical protein VH855_08775 [Acetobacteraceae bacterium]